MKDRLRQDLLQLLSTIAFSGSKEQYWRVVLEGVKLLMGYRDLPVARFELIRIYLKCKAEILDSLTNSDLREDVLDELEAILIGWYPMNDFWTSTFDQFIDHPNFKAYH